MNVPETIRAAIDRHNLIPDGANVVVGVSGGADSIALLHAFQFLKIPCTAAHLNHGLRGAESDADEAFVRNLEFPVVVKSVDVQKLAHENNLSIEMAARQARHDFFSEFDNSVVALAHHADDQAETFILKLARGAGPDGLCGMAPFQNVGELRLIRPMLAIPQSEIYKWLDENGLSWREDASNADETFLRNRVRHTILPMLGNELNPNIRETILRTMNILREENAWMNSLVAETTLESMATLPLAARRRVLRNWLFKQGADGVDYDAVEKILSLMTAGEGTTVFELNDKQRVVVEYGAPRFEEGCPFSSDLHWKLAIEHGNGWRKDHGKGAGVLPAEASFDAGKVGDSPIEVRGHEPGDRMAPLGMQGSRKLQDILTDQKVPRAERNRIPVITCRNEIIWLPGYRTARGWEVQEPSGKAVHVRIEREHEL
ncbi:MAG: tRNA lysidine(34) synthetase TilS [Pontiella sp.]